MIISPFNAGVSDSSGPVDYLLGDKDHTGKKRSVRPEVVRGDVQRVSALIDCNRRKWRYTSGVINFRNGEDPSPDLQKQIMDEFETFAFAGKAANTWDSLWVRHLDKGTVELHFLLPRIDLETGQDINAFQRGWDAHWRPWQRDMCALHGFTDPHTVRQLTGAPKRETEARQKYRHELYQTIECMYQSGDIHSRERLEEFLEVFATINRVSAKTISIKYNDAEKPMKLEGPIFERGFFETPESSRELLSGQKPNGSGGPTEHLRDGYPVLTPRASETDPSPFAGDRARAFKKRREYFATLRSKAQRNDKHIREQLTALDDIRPDADGSGHGSTDFKNPSGRDLDPDNQAGTSAGFEGTGEAIIHGRSGANLDAEVGRIDVGNDGQHVADPNLDIDQRTENQEPDHPGSQPSQDRSDRDNPSFGNTCEHDSANDGYADRQNERRDSIEAHRFTEDTIRSRSRENRHERDTNRPASLDRGTINDRTRSLLDRLARGYGRNANEASRAAQSSRRRAETARQRTLDSALRAEDAERRKHTNGVVAGAIAEISRTFVEITKAARDALGRLTQQVARWLENMRTVKSLPEPEEQEQGEPEAKKEPPRSPSPGM